MEPNERVLKDDGFPVLHSEAYKQSMAIYAGVTTEDKVTFLRVYHKTGNLSKAAKAVGRTRSAFYEMMKTDKAFAQDFLDVKEARCDDLEEVMLDNALTPKGFMDRIAWLRANRSEKYNPDKNDEKNAALGMADSVKALAAKLKDYDLIPKSNVIEPEQ